MIIMDKQEKISENLSVSGTYSSTNESVIANLPTSGPLLNVSQTVSHTSVASGLSENSKEVGDRSLSGASCEATVPFQGGAGEPGNMSMIARMMMAPTGEHHSTPGTSEMPDTTLPDMMSMFKGSGMPLSDMMSMMSEGGMSAMMNKGGMKGGPPMEMARLFECIIDMSLARADSDESEEDEDSVSVELPCQYCCRFFASQMTLKTHILVAHEHEDDSVLNLTGLAIDSKQKHGTKNGSHHSCKHSRDSEIAAAEASGTDGKLSGQNTGSKSMPTHTYAAADSVTLRGVKRGRTESKESESLETGGAAGGEDLTWEQLGQTLSFAQPEHCMFETCGSSDIRKCKPSQHSQHAQMESTSQKKHKKSKTRPIKPNSDPSDNSQNHSSDIVKQAIESFSISEDTESMKLQNEAKDVACSAHKEGQEEEMEESGDACNEPRTCSDSSRSRSSLKEVMRTESPRMAAVAAAGPSGPEEEYPATARRSLRFRKSRY